VWRGKGEDIDFETIPKTLTLSKGYRGFYFLSFYIILFKIVFSNSIRL